MAPSWDAAGRLAAITNIRTPSNYFLSWELAWEEQRQQNAPIREQR